MVSKWQKWLYNVVGPTMQGGVFVMQIQVVKMVKEIFVVIFK
jgi:hypothetical protein